MISNNHSTKNSGTTDQSEQLKKYIKIIKKRKWSIVITTFVVLFLWSAYVFLFQSRPLYSSSALLLFQDPRGLSAVEDNLKEYNTSKVTLLETNRLLGQIVDQFQFNLSVISKDINKEELFSYVNVSSNSEEGEYEIVKSKNGYELYFSNDLKKIKNRNLMSFGSDDTVRINNITFLLNEEFIQASELEKFEFRIKKFEKAISDVKNLIAYRWLDRYGINLEITASHTSPETAAKIANAVANVFITMNMNMKGYKSKKVLEILKNQLDLAQKDLDVANQKLQDFREKNPWVSQPGSVDLEATSPVTKITDFEEQKNRMSLIIEDIKSISDRLVQSSDLNDRISSARELLTYLISEGIPTGSAIDAELTKLVDERTALSGKYAKSHPLMTSTEAKIGDVITKAKGVADNYTDKLSKQFDNLKSDINTEKYKLRKLPSKERELAELIIDQGVKRDLYEKILVKYNEAQINTKVEVGDIVLLDDAPAPPLQGGLRDLLKKCLLGFFLGLGLGVGVAFLVEFFDKTVQSVSDLQLHSNYSVLGSIPYINGQNDKPTDLRKPIQKKEPKLITLDYSPTLESEAYRDLRTKILYANKNNQISSFIITSLRPSEGKSLSASNLAITFAQQKVTTLLIDADLRRGVLHNVFGNKKKPGLSDFLISKATIDETNVNKLIQSTFVPNLFIITSGSPIPNPTEILGSDRFSKLLSLLKARFGFVIIDTAPFQASSDAVILSRSVDGILLIVRAAYTNVEQLHHKISEYPSIQDKILGIILNMEKLDMRKVRYQYSYYNY
jgi:capsular exopolysaccharide synthesis family protein